jgi:hypothetical protein
MVGGRRRGSLLRVGARARALSHSHAPARTLSHSLAPAHTHATRRVHAGQGTQWAITGPASPGRVTIQFCFYQSTPLYMFEIFEDPLDSALLAALPAAARPPLGVITGAVLIQFQDFEAVVPPAALFVEPPYCHC